MQVITNPFRLLWIKTFGKKKYEEGLSKWIKEMCKDIDVSKITVGKIDATVLHVRDK